MYKDLNKIIGEIIKFEKRHIDNQEIIIPDELLSFYINRTEQMYLTFKQQNGEIFNLIDYLLSYEDYITIARVLKIVSSNVKNYIFCRLISIGKISYFSEIINSLYTEEQIEILKSSLNKSFLINSFLLATKKDLSLGYNLSLINLLSLYNNDYINKDDLVFKNQEITIPLEEELYLLGKDNVARYIEFLKMKDIRVFKIALRRYDED